MQGLPPIDRLKVEVEDYSPQNSNLPGWPTHQADTVSERIFRFDSRLFDGGFKGSVQRSLKRSGCDGSSWIAESVSYADTRQSVRRLAGLPERLAHIESLSTRRTPKSLAQFNAAYVLAQQDELADV